MCSSDLKIADVLDDRDEPPSLLPLPPAAADQRELLDRIDAALPLHGVVTELAWSAPAEEETYAERRRDSASPADSAEPPLLPFITDSKLHAMIDDLYAEVGAASFTVTWQHDPRGLLSAAVAFLADLRLLRPLPGGVLVLPAAARYRNIKLALPVRRAEGQLALDLFGGAGDFGGDGDG